MPCNSDYLNPTNREFELQRTAKLLVFVRKSLGQQIPAELKRAASDIYCKDDYVAELCGVLKNLTPALTDRIVYNAQNKTSRGLADWWEEHQEADRKRIASEKRVKLEQKLREKALAKLTPKEKRILGL